MDTDLVILCPFQPLLFMGHWELSSLGTDFNITALSHLQMEVTQKTEVSNLEFALNSYKTLG
jgi:hypothetical protein